MKKIFQADKESKKLDFGCFYVFLVNSELFWGTYPEGLCKWSTGMRSQILIPN